jgi:hypothetical protein
MNHKQCISCGLPRELLRLQGLARELAESTDALTALASARAELRIVKRNNEELEAKIAELEENKCKP